MNMKTKCMIKQKLLGIGLLVLSLVTILVAMDATIAVFLIPMGLYTLFTKECLEYEELLELDD